MDRRRHPRSMDQDEARSSWTRSDACVGAGIEARRRAFRPRMRAYLLALPVLLSACGGIVVDDRASDAAIDGSVDTATAIDGAIDTPIDTSIDASIDTAID